MEIGEMATLGIEFVSDRILFRRQDLVNPHDAVAVVVFQNLGKAPFLEGEDLGGMGGIVEIVGGERTPVPALAQAAGLQFGGHGRPGLPA